MACSKPLFIPWNKYHLNSDKELRHIVFNPLRMLYAQDARSFDPRGYGYTVPCGWCTNCRVDKINQMIDRCEYEYIQYNCGAFVTFTYDDDHLQPHMFYDTKSKCVRATLSKSDAKKFLDRLNKSVHDNVRKFGRQYCNPDYKYILVGEYGENGSCFDRPHYHCLFFGLDFKICERLFWRAWKFKGSIQVGPIKNGGIHYVLEYIDKQLHGKQSFYKYDYHHLVPPFQWHSSNLGLNLYTTQRDYINSHNGCYHWRGKDKPVPAYYRNMLNITSGLSDSYQIANYRKLRSEYESRYGVQLDSLEKFNQFMLEKACLREERYLISQRQHGKPVLDYSFLMQEVHDLIYRYNGTDKNRLCNQYDESDFVIIPASEKYMPIRIHHSIKYG